MKQTLLEKILYPCIGALVLTLLVAISVCVFALMFDYATALKIAAQVFIGVLIILIIALEISYRLS